jgi:uncharacterized protein (TIGR02611 family)
MMQKARKVAVGIVGGVVLVIGVILIPYPGPGWLVVFAGLGILSTEFTWAQRLLDYAKNKYDGWTQWVAKQNIVVKSAIWLLTAMIVVTTIWLLNGYGIINNILHLGWDLVKSPLPIFR